MALRLALIMGIVGLVAASMVMAADTPGDKPGTVTLVGTVLAVKDANGLPLSVELVTKFQIGLNKQA